MSVYPTGYRRSARIADPFSLKKAIFTDNMIDFAERACFGVNGERIFRSTRKFRFYSIGKIQGKRVNQEILLDLNVFFDPDDEYLSKCLSLYEPEIDWERIIFIRSMDCSAISLARWDTGAEIGELRMMGWTPRRRAISAESLLDPKVIDLEDRRQRRLMSVE